MIQFLGSHQGLVSIKLKPSAIHGHSINFSPFFLPRKIFSQILVVSPTMKSSFRFSQAKKCRINYIAVHSYPDCMDFVLKCIKRL